MERSPVFSVHKKGINTADFLRNYLCPFYDQCLGEAASQNLYLDCSSCQCKGAHIDHLMVNPNHLEDYPSPK